MTQTTAMRHKRGGLYFEDFVVGELFEHRYTRTVTQMDNMLFSNMTLNPQPLHIDRHFCETETEWGQPLMNSLFTLGLMIGISGQRHDGRHHHRQSRHDRREIPASAVRGRHRPLHHRGPGQARVEVAARRRHRRIPPPRLQPGRQAGRRMPPPGLHAHAAGVSDAMRSLLFVPADSARKLDKALASGADALILDLEDSIAPDAQGGGARRRARDSSSERRAERSARACWCASTALDDRPDRRRSRRRRAGAPGRASCCRRRKAARPSSHLDAKLAAREAIAGLPDGSIKHPRASRPRPRRRCSSPAPIAARARGSRASPGARRTSPPSSAPRPTATRDGRFLDPYRLARSALPRWRGRARKVPAIDTVYVDFRNDDGLRRETEEARRDGFTGKLAIHPAQVRGHQRGVHAEPDAIAQRAGGRRGLRGSARRRRRRHRRRDVRPPAPGARQAPAGTRLRFLIRLHVKGSHSQSP